MFKVNNRNTKRRREICSKLTIKTQERRHWLNNVISRKSKYGPEVSDYQLETSFKRCKKLNKSKKTSAIIFFKCNKVVIGN